MNRPAPPWLAIRSAIASISAVRAGAISTIAPSRRRRRIGRQQGRIGRAGAGHEAQRSRLVEPDCALQPLAADPDKLADRHGVEQLVGDDDQRLLGQLAMRLVPGDAAAAFAERRLLDVGQPRARLDHGESALPAQDAASSLPTVRSMSFISVPRPGPISASVTGSGRPIACQALSTQTPISSPNIWLISGAVMKSPAAPNGSRVV